MTSSTPTVNLFEHADGGEHYAAGHIFFRAGERGDHMFAVQEGEVDLLVGDTVVETAGPRTIFGELALLDGEPRSATAVARTACTVVAVDQARFMLMVRQTPFFAIELFRILAHRLRNADARIAH